MRKNKLRVANTGIGTDSTTLRYNCEAASFTLDGIGFNYSGRRYIVGNTAGFALAPPGIRVANFYSDGKFLPGTKSKWIPNVGFTTSGRIYVAFTTNPEVMTAWETLASTGTPSDIVDFVRGFGNVQSWPIYQEHTVVTPSILRRRMFDVNGTTSSSGDLAVNIYDRCVQIYMMQVIVGGPATTTVGAFEYTDVVYCEGLTNATT